MVPDLVDAYTYSTIVAHAEIVFSPSWVAHVGTFDHQQLVILLCIT